MRVPCTKCLSRGAECKVTGGGRTNECDLCRFSRIKCEGLELAGEGAKSASTMVAGGRATTAIPAGIGIQREDRPAKRLRLEEEEDSAFETRELMQRLIYHLERDSKAQEQLVEEMRGWRKEWRAKEARRRKSEEGPDEVIEIEDDFEEKVQENEKEKENDNEKEKEKAREASEKGEIEVQEEEQEEEEEEEARQAMELFRPGSDDV